MGPGAIEVNDHLHDAERQHPDADLGVPLPDDLATADALA
jgi:hypothetical protein